MKKTYILCVAAVALLSFTFSSCSKVVSALAGATSISWTGIDVPITIDPQHDTTVADTVGVGSFSYNLDSLIKSQTSNTLGLSNIDTFEITVCRVTILNPSTDDNFANFQSSDLLFYTSYNTTMLNVGEIDNNPDVYAETLTIPTTSTNLKTYISPLGNTTFHYALQGKLRRPTGVALNLNIHLEYNIHVKP